MYKRLMLAALGALPMALFADTAGLQADNAYVRGMPPGRTVTAAFFDLENSSNRDCQLVAVAANAAKRAEIHTHLHEAGMMKMRHIKQVAVPAHGAVAFEPGGYHVMLFGVGGLTEGVPVRIELQFSDCDPLSFDAPVKHSGR